ncbi:hypothetical protein PO369_22280 [Phytobacter diazotrophicus]|uniref:hypothetical protein n=1 Tax=Phytobacter diazotrophicus TaxID=395631 RepID=UPI002FF8026C
MDTGFLKAITENDIQLLNEVIENGTKSILEKGAEIKGGKRYIDFLTLDDQIVEEINDGVSETFYLFLCRCEGKYYIIERCLLVSIVNQELLKQLGYHLGMIK